jgi:hypothetical protein
MASEPVLERAPGALLRRRQLGDDERGGDAVFVAHRVRDRVAERLLVAQEQLVAGELRQRAHDPLEARQRLHVLGASGLGHAPQERGRSHRRHEQRPARVLSVLEQEVGKQRASLIPV